ncbi:hypothetical protein G6F32_003747 [Rhizopus arrhizus]|nr:hypothetical protein G6F32_003747 [Rhizopus arrhizus]
MCSACLFNDYLKPEKSLYDTLADDKRFTKFVDEIERHNLTFKFKAIKAGTVFAPVNQAFDHDDDDSHSTPEQVLYHVIPVAIKSNEFWDGRLLETEAYRGDLRQFLKVTKTTFKGDIIIGTGVEANRAQIVQADIDASNGVIHTVDNFLPLPVNLDETLALDNDLQDFCDLVNKAHMDQELKNTKGYTIFATKESVFGNDLSDIEKDYLNSKEGRYDLARILKHQISPKIFYTNDFAEGKSKIETVEGSEFLAVLVHGNSITVNDIKVIKSNILSANGVIHVLEKPLLPKNKDFLNLDTRKVLSAIHATNFGRLLDNNGLGHYLDKDQIDKVTILAPPNDKLDEGNVPKNQMKAWLEYHIVRNRYRPSDFSHGQLLETHSHDDLGDSYYQHIPVTISEPNKLIQFDKSHMLRDPVEIGSNVIIYPIAHRLVLPRNTVNRLPANLELSTFVASLYASDSDKAIEKAHGITLFAPTNKAFTHLGLLAEHLLQPESRKKLEQVIKYHAVCGLFYANLTAEGEHKEETLASDSRITLNKTSAGFFIRGHGAADENDRAVIAKVIRTDILTSNGVIHTIDRVQLPENLEVSNHNLLSAEGTIRLLGLLKYGNMPKNVLNGTSKDEPYTVLAPSDRAFARTNLSHLSDEKLAKLAKLHVIPLGLPRLDTSEIGKKRWWASDNNEHRDIGYTGTEFPSLLSKDTVIVINKNIGGGYSVNIKGSSQGSADILDLGRSSSGGGVLVIDRVLVLPEEARQKRWPWWVIALIVIGVFVVLSLLAICVYYAWKWYASRREGQVSL